jgi:dolichol-phosphate mannosyltransferase
LFFACFAFYYLRRAMNQTLIIVPTYNERENLPRMAQKLLSLPVSVDLLVVDDNSPDGTGKIVDEIAARDPRVHAIHRAGKQGLGTAILVAMNYAMDKNYDLMVNMDADFSHSPNYLPAVLAGMAHRDVMIGSRYIRGGGSRNWPLSRRAISKTVNAVVRLLFRMQVRDASGGYRCYRVAKLRQTLLTDLWSRGYSFQQEILYRCHLAGCKLGETPIIFDNRKLGKSKVSPKESVRSLSLILYLGMRSVFGIDKDVARRKREHTTSACTSR